MNESDTRLNKIDPALRAAQWGVEDGSYIRTEYYFTRGKISRTKKGEAKKADYALIYRGVLLAIVEAKSDELSYAEGVPQALHSLSDAAKVRQTFRSDGFFGKKPPNYFFKTTLKRRCTKALTLVTYRGFFAKPPCVYFDIAAQK